MSPLIRSIEVAAILGVANTTLEAWRIKGKGPRFLKVGKGAIRYDRKDVAEWIEAQKVSSTSEYGQ